MQFELNYLSPPFVKGGLGGDLRVEKHALGGIEYLSQTLI